MKLIKRTKLIIIATAAIWLVWDVYVAIKYGSAATESNIIMHWALSHWSIATIIGFLCGHFFWNVKRVKNHKLRFVIALVLCVLMITTDFYLGIKVLFGRQHVFLFGFILGRAIWPQKPKAEYIAVL